MESVEKMSDFIEREGLLVDEYIVDESQTVSSAGSAEVYRVSTGHYFEIITWNECAVEHEEDSKTINDVTEAYKEYESEWIDDEIN